MTKTVFIIATLFLSFSVSFAQEVERKKIQASLAFPIGNHGTNSIKYANQFSFNTTVGINGGVNGFELGGVANINNGDVSGFQLAGVTNITHGSSNSTVIAGVLNLSSDSIEGFHLAGVANIANANAKGTQISTLNIIKNNFSGFQLGVVNIAGKVNGVQIGLVNISKDASSGTPIGLVNIVKGGYKAFEATTSDVFYANIAYKMGVKRSYTIYELGYSDYNDKNVLKLGVGLGSIISLSPKHQLAIEALSSQVLFDNQFKDLNILNKLKINYQFALTPKIRIVAGPSFNVYVTSQKLNNKYGTIDIPKTIFRHNGNKTMVASWIGFNAGISFEL